MLGQLFDKLQEHYGIRVRIESLGLERIIPETPLPAPDRRKKRTASHPQSRGGVNAKDRLITTHQRETQELSIAGWQVRDVSPKWT